MSALRQFLSICHCIHLKAKGVLIRRWLLNNLTWDSMGCSIGFNGPSSDRLSFMGGLSCFVSFCSWYCCSNHNTSIVVCLLLLNITLHSTWWINHGRFSSSSYHCCGLWVWTGTGGDEHSSWYSGVTRVLLFGWGSYNRQCWVRVLSIDSIRRSSSSLRTNWKDKWFQWLKYWSLLRRQ